MKPLCHPDRPHAARRLCKACYNARYRRHQRLDDLSATLTVWMALAAAERQRKHDPRKYVETNQSPN